MLDSKDIQKKREEEELKAYGKPWLDSTRILMLSFIICAVIILPICIVAVIVDKDEEEVYSCVK